MCNFLSFSQFLFFLFSPHPPLFPVYLIPCFSFLVHLSCIFNAQSALGLLPIFLPLLLLLFPDSIAWFSSLLYSIKLHPDWKVEGVDFWVSCIAAPGNPCVSQHSSGWETIPECFSLGWIRIMMDGGFFWELLRTSSSCWISPSLDLRVSGNTIFKSAIHRCKLNVRLQKRCLTHFQLIF